MAHAAATAPIPKVPISRLLTQMRHGARLDLRDSHRVLSERFGPVVSQGVGPYRSVLLFGPDANRMVLLDRGKCLSSRIPWMWIMGGTFPNGLLLRDGTEHLAHRRIMHEAFTAPFLSAYAEGMNRAIGASLEKLAGRRLAFDAFKTLTLDIAANTFVGEELGTDAAAMKKAFEAMVAASVPSFDRLLPVGRYRRGLAGRRYMLDYLGQRLARRRDGNGEDLFSRLATARTPEGDTFSDEDVLDHMNFLLMAAHDTTTSTLTSLALELGRNRTWQDRVRAESMALPSDHVGFEEVEALSALTRCMREALRMYPPLPVIPRSTRKEIEWCGHVIPKATMVVVSPIHTHYMPQWWDQPETWDPDRFSPERAEDRRHSHSWVPFGGGVHLCLGKRFAETQVRQIVHQLVRRYRWTVDERYPVRLQHMPISKPLDGLPITFERLA